MTYVPALRGFHVTMPISIELRAKERWRSKLQSALAKLGVGVSFNLLIDTNRHEFESIACIRALRDVLEAPEVTSRCERTAFVSPATFRRPEVVSDREAYFIEIADALAWLEVDV